MSKIDLSVLDTGALVERFAAACVAQDEALLAGQTTKFNRLYDVMITITDELKNRDGDQRRALLRLFSHANMQVRVQAAKLTLAVAPVEARRQLQAISASKWYPQAGDAGMSLRNLESGIFKPT